MVVLLVIIWLMAGMLAVHIAGAAKLEGPIRPSDVWFSAAGGLALVAVLMVCVKNTIQKARES